MAARNTANCGHTLNEATREALPAGDRAKWDALDFAGAETALTLKWHADRCEARLGVVPDDAEPLTMLALNFPRVAEAQTKAVATGALATASVQAANLWTP